MGDDVGRLDLAGRHSGDFELFKKSDIACLAATYRAYFRNILAILLENLAQCWLSQVQRAFWCRNLLREFPFLGFGSGSGLRLAIESPGFSMNYLAVALNSYLAEIR